MTLTQAFLNQSETCTRMGSPLMGRVLKILADRWDETSKLGQKMAEYQGDTGPAGHSLPLRIGGGLHALVLQARDPDLIAAYPPNYTDDATLESAVIKALKTNEDFFLDWTVNAPQTNEVRRSAALIPMAHVATSYFDRPIVLSELGASGGLNLMWDHFALRANDTHFGPQGAVLTLEPEWSGPVPAGGSPQIVDRSGVDLNPLNLQDETDTLRLLSYLWADQPHRVDLTRAAMSVLTAKVEKGDAIDWLEQRLASAPEGHMHMIQHTVAWQYFPKEKQEHGTALIEAAGSRATPETPIAWVQMETDGDATGAVGAALTLRLWPGDITLHLGRADFHGRWINWAG
ncbi:hypothetical protein GCM10007385_20220 [Tateyamaria omphalii]|uniref:DUF2332 domain-containing protein n=1 Tax=Tateyamaria omphalii TaxID=299262 RepID=UPI00167BFA9E|nr:DUF2332 family protein [Tateyamaria omphalii]GGX51544.1 hypothetical protein GCM10007385_20220 [Tateyamaria omphalii]